MGSIGSIIVLGIFVIGFVNHIVFKPLNATRPLTRAQMEKIAAEKARSAALRERCIEIGLIPG